MVNTPTPRTDEFLGTLERHEGRIAWSIKDIEALVERARQLEQELNEAKDAYRQLQGSDNLLYKRMESAEAERDQLRKELSNKTGYAHLVAEIGQLRKMIDAFAECDCGDEWLMADYRELPHVRTRKMK